MRAAACLSQSSEPRVECFGGMDGFDDQTVFYGIRFVKGVRRSYSNEISKSAFFSSGRCHRGVQPDTKRQHAAMAVVAGHRPAGLGRCARQAGADSGILARGRLFSFAAGPVTHTRNKASKQAAAQ